MNKEEIENKIKELKRREFVIQMCDHWTREDYEDIHKIEDELRRCYKELEDLEKGE